MSSATALCTLISERRMLDDHRLHSARRLGVIRWNKLIQ